jgi:acyl carrier protein
VSSNETRAAIRSFIETTIAKKRSFSDEQDLFEAGIVDSLQIQQLLAFIEDTFGVVVGDEYFFDERFASVVGQADIVEELRAAAK